MGPVVVAAWPPLQPEQREGGAGPWRGEARRATSLSSAFHSFLPMPPNRMAALKKIFVQRERRLRTQHITLMILVVYSLHECTVHIITFRW